jgi:uncharacterized membrane protein YhaH (DUF805 family)
MSPIAAVTNGFKNYVNFKGRATRSEYWWWVLFVILLQIVTSSITDQLANVASLVVFLPGLAVLARRLHDTGRSAWWMASPIALVTVAIIAVVALLTSVGLDLANVDSWDPESAFEGASATLVLLAGVTSLAALILVVIVWVVFPCLKSDSGMNKYGPPAPPASQTS